MMDWLQPIERDREALNDAGLKRLLALQHLLCELVTELDDKRSCYPFDLEKAQPWAL